MGYHVCKSSQEKALGNPLTMLFLCLQNVWGRTERHENAASEARTDTQSHLLQVITCRRRHMWGEARHKEGAALTGCSVAQQVVVCGAPGCGKTHLLSRCPPCWIVSNHLAPAQGRSLRH